MKNLIIIIFLTISSVVYSQSQYGFDCGFTDSSGALNSSIFGSSFTGLNKPIRTDLSGDSSSPSNSVFPIIIVFVQFKNDNNDWQWPTNSAPIYLDSLISQTKSYNSNWWDAYNEQTEPLSDYWLELSRGKFHVTGKAFSVVLDKFDYQYTTDHELNLEVWRKINDSIPDWRVYDKWRDTTINNQKKFYYEPDGYVDMIYKIHKRYGGPLATYRGYAHLTASQYDYDSILVDTTNQIKVGYGFRGKGSGLTLSWTARKHLILSVLPHEHGHYLYANGHITYGKVSYGPGADGYFSPYEMILLNYQSADTVNFNSQVQYSLKDYSSRDNSNGEILRVPIQGNNECFLIASRGRISKWDKPMLGDSSQIIGSYEYNGNYGKGLYIYHVNDLGIIYPNGYNIQPQDEECADGIWYWSNRGQTQRYAWDAGYCYNASSWTYYLRDSVSYNNDEGWNYSPADGRSHAFPIWAGIGKINSDACLMGTDRMHSNTAHIYPNEEVLGDRYDAWNVGYNEVFSPYSSPSTKAWDNSNSGIFIWHYSNSGSGPSGLAYLKIYKAGVGEPISLDSALHLTPPSRPMGLKVEDFHPSGTYSCYPKLTWNHNMEPDMVRTGNLKKYKVYAAADSLMTLIPYNYVLTATLEIHSDSIPAYVDYNVHIFGCPYSQGTQGEKYPVRYYVKSVDKYEDISVPSDFVQTVGETGAFLEEEPDNLISINPDIPKEYYLDQNYPNPFNPVTKIRYDLPFDGKVNIRIYDINGRLIFTLINENKTAGRYEMEFNGDNLSSGVYYYKIESGSFYQVRKMILIK